MTMDQYLAQRHIGAALSSGGFTSVQKAWLRGGITPCVPILLSSFTDVLFAIPGTGLMCTVQKRLADRWGGALGLAVVEPPFEIDPVRIELLWHAKNEDDPALRFLRHELKQATVEL